jgi:hypothetical protein
MRKIALAVVLAASAIGLLAAMTRPPVEQLVEGQQQCGNGTAVCLGDKTHVVRLQGSVSFEKSTAALAFTRNPDGGPSTLTTADNAITSSTKAIINYDLPALAATFGGPNCFDTRTATIANCPFGSALLLGVDQVLAGNGTVQPYLSAANTVIVRGCVSGVDAGNSFDMPDASYIVRCIP